MKKQLTSCGSAVGSQYRKRGSSHAWRDLDLSKIAVDNHWPELLRAFDAVRPGESLAVLGVKNCGQTLRQLQLQRPAACDWIALSVTDSGTRVELRRRLDTQKTSVSDHFETDHERLHALLAQVVTLLRTGSIRTASEQCERFRNGVERHMDAEESVLFPLMEQAYGLAIGARTVMGAEHGTIRERSASLASMMASASLDECINAALELSELLARHSMKEERILYPMIDRWVGEQHSRRALVSQVLIT